ncbi:NAD-dependent epimerase/dehydratase family protein [Glutamicibacter sp.]|uniref:NAD-dependent epimerase/dehydratase family protein n=1 Tax=Glutamicibacter sp. TaxID=1931995 RepID=UPI0028BE67E5|nr:NAD-dependent epimerase/dehydratase family protein [Glutamicibacter sp.]
MSRMKKFAHWQRTESQFLAAEADAAYSIVGNLAQTGTWMKVFSFRVHDDQRGVGTKVDLLPPGKIFGMLHQNTAPAGSITRRNQDARMVEFTQPQPAGRMVLRWRVDEAEGGCILHFTIEIHGPGTTAFKFTVGNTLCHDFTVAVARLYRMVAHTAHIKLDAHVVIAGGRGFLGRNLAADLVCRGASVAVLSRTREDYFPTEQFIWDGIHQGTWIGAFHSDRPVHLVNLAGERVDKRNTPENIAELTNSRVLTTQTLAEAVAKREELKTWIQSSTTAIFGDAGEAELTESSPIPTGERALPEMTGVASAWEQAFTDAKVNAKHSYILRTSLVMHPDAPLLGPLNLLTNIGLGGKLGHGKQWFSWIGMEDWLRVIRCLLGLEQPHIPDGIVHATAPNPLRNEEIMAQLRSLAGMPGLPTGSLLPKLGAAVMGNNARVVLTGRKVRSEVLEKAGFKFEETSFLSTVGR